MTCMKDMKSKRYINDLNAYYQERKSGSNTIYNHT